MVWNLVFAIAWVGIFILSIGGIFLSILPKYILSLNVEEPIFRMILGGISVVYLLLFIEKFSRIFEKEKSYEVNTESGTIRISSYTVNNLVKNIVENNPKVKHVKVKNRLQKKKLSIFVKMDVISTPNLSEMISDMQEEIKSKVMGALEIETGKVQISVEKLIKDRKEGYYFKKGDLEQEQERSED